eukprot:scaffold9690_cov67-Phaeocystis_antarctica.AAC.1
MHRPQLRRVAEALWLANTRYGSFGSPLGLVLAQDGGGLRFRRLTATSSEVTMPYPAWAARPDGAQPNPSPNPKPSPSPSPNPDPSPNSNPNPNPNLNQARSAFRPHWRLLTRSRRSRALPCGTTATGRASPSRSRANSLVTGSSCHASSQVEQLTFLTLTAHHSPS